MDDLAWRELATTQYVDDDLEIDTNAVVLTIDDPNGKQGAWIQAWVWVDAPPTDEEDTP